MDELSGSRRPRSRAGVALIALLLVGAAVVAAVWLVVARRQASATTTGSTPQAVISGFLRAYNSHDRDGAVARACGDRRTFVEQAVERTSQQLIRLRRTGAVKRQRPDPGGYGASSPARPELASASLTGQRANRPGDGSALIVVRDDGSGRWCVLSLVGLIDLDG